MICLLDTHTLLWATLAPGSPRLSTRAADILRDEANQILVSAASAWEIATKVRLGRLPDAEGLDRNFLSDMDDAGYTLLSIETTTALRAGRLAGENGDPFDRMLAAQALALDIPILSRDTKLDIFGVQRIW